MASSVRLPDDFTTVLKIKNAQERIDEAAQVAEKAGAAEIPLERNLDHAAIFTDPPYLVAGPLKEVGYFSGWDARCYPSPVDEHDYMNVSARLSPNSPARERGWCEYVAVVHPIDQAALKHMESQGYGNPFVHHLTWGITPPERGSDEEFAYTSRVIPFMVKTRRQMAEAIGDEPGTLICALPQTVIEHPEFRSSLPGWLDGSKEDEYMIEPMQGGGFLIQFFVLTGGRIEVAMRHGTQQTFNPKSVHKISEDEISTVQD